MKNRGPKKILHIVHGFSVGGAEIWLLACVRYLKAHPELKAQFDFLVTGGKKAKLDDDIIAAGSTIFYAKYTLKDFFSFRKSFKKILQVNKYSAVHNHLDFVAGWQYLAVADVLPKIRVVHIHNGWDFVLNYKSSLSRKVSYWLGRFLVPFLATAITGTSNAVMDEYGYDKFPFSTKRKQATYCGFDINRFAFDEEAKKAICSELGWENDPKLKIGLFVGRIWTNLWGMRNDKNPGFAFAIARALVKNDDHWRFIFAGDKGPVGKKFEERTKGLGVNHRIKFLGFRDDIARLMSAADILIFPSIQEGLGMVAVEAQATGLPVLMSDKVPKEAIVCPDLVTELSLKRGPKGWVRTCHNVFASKRRPRLEYNLEVARSDFIIQNSVQKLLQLYTQKNEN